MRIVIDLQACQGSSTNRGIGRYSMALLQAMLRQAGGHELRVALNGALPDGVDQLRASLGRLMPASQISCYSLPAQIWEHQPLNSWRLRAAEQLREHYLASLAPDVVHVSSLFDGFGEDACVSLLHGRGQFDSAVTLYDLIPLLRKETYLGDPHVANWYYRKLQSLKNAELLLAISGHSRQEALDALQLAPERVVNISSAVDAIFAPRRQDAAQRAALRARYGLRRDYIMYTGGIDYRKNIEALVEAYAMLPAPLRARYQLAVVCSVQPADRLRLQALAARCRLPEGDLVLTGFVPDDDLVSLYNDTALFVFPSLQEGFGLPALEAMSCGVPVIGSHNSSIPEVIGRADALFDPTRPDAIAAKMAQVLEQPDFAAELAGHGLRQARLFSWDASARRALDAFEQLHARRQAAARTSVAAAPARRPRLAYVSPLPPERTGVADQSVELLPELARYYDIEVVVSQPEVRERWVEANFPVRSADWFDQNAERYDRILYHFGNSAFHAHMFALLARHPGVVVMHDFYLSGAVNYLASASQTPNAYCQMLYASHGYRALVDEAERGREASYYEYPCNKAVLDQAAGVIVHSSYSRTLAERWYGAGRAADWRYIPLLRALPGPLDRGAARAALGLAEDDFLVCSFGLVAITKCNEKILEAWLDRAELNEDTRCHLVFVGENHVGKFGNALAARMAGRPRVKITGFVSQEQFRAYLAAADCAVQLRSRSRGETSGTILDSLAYRLPTIINAHGSAAEVPDEVVLKLPDDFSAGELSDAILRLRDEAGLAAGLVRRALAHMHQVHHPAHVGALYHEAIEQIARHSPQARYAELLAGLGGIAAAAAPSQADWLQTAACIAANGAGWHGRQLLVEVGVETGDGAADADADAAARALLLQLLLAAPPGLRVEPVRLVGQRYHYARAHALELIGRADLALDDAVADIRPGDCLLGLAPPGPPPPPPPRWRGAAWRCWRRPGWPRCCRPATPRWPCWRAPPGTPMRAEPTPQLLLDLSELIGHDARSGVQRVSRAVLLALLAAPPPGRRVRPVYDAGGYYAYAEAEAGGGWRRAAPGAEAPLRTRPGDLFFGLDLALEQVARNQALLAGLRRHGVRLYFFVHDLLPLRHPEWFEAGVCAAFERWLAACAALADGLLCNSRATADDLLDWLGQAPPARAAPLQVGYCHLGADLAASAPSAGLGGADEAVLAALAARPTLLMVGTLEPRKMHAQALQALERLWRDGVECNLVVVGKPGWRVEHVARRLRGHAEAGRRLFWLEAASDELLARLYRGSSALLAASAAEGFGLPLVEAAQHGLPVIARDLAVFREVGGGHAWYFRADDGAALAAALADWLALRAAGRAPASAAMPRLSWADAAGQMLACLLEQRWYRQAPVRLAADPAYTLSQY
ncbi:glycosyltransferase [Rugamonas sp. DEMB1]|uniref:glycosyltransferase n=1 Tax=Rugamonas sp. DEMB1 TaxID=3039386 RepID=UPI00244B86C8|nr:glycosyltransferase [Rugamonas sp. DEMB1]WGG51374.1 glycosyltransferase [Rugamonas sp. DEMB1]